MGAGTLSISSDGNLGAVPSGPTPNSLTLDGGTLRTIGNVTLNSARGITLMQGNGTFDVSGPTGSLQYSGAITGGGGLTKIGAGTLTLGGANISHKGYGASPTTPRFDGLYQRSRVFYVNM